MKTPWCPCLPVPEAAFRAVRTRTIFDCCKWDPQVEDVTVLSPQPVVLAADVWQALGRDAEALYQETVAAERALLTRPELHAQLGLPRAVRRVLARAGRQGPCPAAARVFRFDFHATTDGWRVSEVNADVPGGYIEASGFARLMHAYYPHLSLPDDPAAALVAAVRRATRPGATIGLVHATAYTDDRQVMVFLARQLAAHGLATCLLSPAALTWEGGRAAGWSDTELKPLDALVRFFPAEWLPNLPQRTAWAHFFVGAQTPQSNPATALLVQSKRLPLVWDALGLELPTWRRLLPETHAPRAVSLATGDWILKPALGRVGEDIALCGVTPPRVWQSAVRRARWWPRDWVAQRRFTPLPLDTEAGPRFPCIGVYVIDGAAAGAYVRLGRTPLVDHTAEDAALLIAPAAPELGPEVCHDDAGRGLCRVGAADGGLVALGEAGAVCRA